MNRSLVLVLILICTIFQLYPFEIKLGTDGIFRGDSIIISKNLYYNGTVYSNDLSETTGFFDSNFKILKATTIIPGGGRIFSDSISHKRPVMFSKIFIPGEIYFEKFGKTITRLYDFNRGYWISNETAYNRDESKEKSLIYDREDRIFLPLAKWFMYLGLINLFFIQSINYLCPRHQIRPMTLQVFILIAVLVLLFSILDNKYVEWTLLLPICLWGIFVGISKLTINKLRAVFIIASIVLPLTLAIYQFAVTQSSILLSDGNELPIKWRCGTDLIKRIVVRAYISKMKSINQDNQYLCKNELTEYEYSIISGELMSWISLITPNKVKTNVSFDEAQLFIKELNDVVGYNYFYIPSAETWSKSIDQRDKPSLNIVEEEAHGINRGISSANGFIDLGSNLKEITSSPISVYYTNANGIPCKIPDYIIAKGGSYCDSISSFDNTVIPKNLAASNLGIRLSLDLLNLSKPSKVYGLLLDTVGAILPKKIELIAINGVRVNKSWDIVERELIELSAYSREYTVQTESGDIHKISIQQNTEPYIFTPEK